MSYVDEVLERVIAQNPAQPEFHQAVRPHRRLSAVQQFFIALTGPTTQSERIFRQSRMQATQPFRHPL